MATFKISVSQAKRSDNKYQVRIRFTHKRQSVYLKTPYYVDQSDLNGKHEVIAVDLHSELITRISNYARKLILLGCQVDTMTVQQLAGILNKPVQIIPINLIHYWRNKIKDMSVIKSVKTIRCYNAAVNRICLFLGKEELYPQFLNIRLLNDFEINMRTIAGVRGRRITGTSINLYMTCIKNLTGIYIDESDEDFKDPFRKYTLPKKEVPVKRSLDVELLRVILNAETTSKNEALAKDYFLISFLLCGANCIDIYNLKKPVKGRIFYERSKTKNKRDDRALISILVQPELTPLIEKYSDPIMCFNFHSKYKDSNILNATVNRALKTICERIKIPVITTYFARHSWGNIGRNDLHIDFKDISIALNHSQNTVTDKYLKKDFTIIDRCNRLIIDYVFETKSMRVVSMVG